MESQPIDPKKLIEELSVEEFNRYSDEYYKKLPQAEMQMGKPFSMHEHTPQLLVRLGLMLESLRLSPGMKVLDFGAGTCWLSKAIWQMGCTVIATDVSAEALRLGRRLFNEYPIPTKPRCSWDTRLFDGRRLPANDEEIDRIICFDTFHHVPNQEEVVQEFYRVLRNGGTVVMNEPIGPHSSTPDSQHEMREFNVLENDLDMGEMEALFGNAGFDGPAFKLAATPNYLMNYNEWQDFVKGGVPQSAADAVSDFLQNSGVFYFQKGRIFNDSRYPYDLAHELVCDQTRLALKAGQPQSVNVTVTNTGKSRWIIENEAFIGVTHIASRLLDFKTKALIKDATRFPLPKEMEPGDRFSGDVPLHVDAPGKYWLKLDIVSERVCWLEDLGSKPVFIEVDVEP